MQKPQISLITAMAENRVIGNQNGLPWRLPNDLKHFKEITMGKPMIMGRKTWESLPGVLPGRPHLVITRDPEYGAAGCTVVYSLEQALSAAGDIPEVMVVGGANIYQQFLPRADRIYLTQVHAEVEGDAFFPTFDASLWRELEKTRHEEDEKHACAYTFITLVRK
ncbi:MAG: dihydrofolate reductase [Gammaproteobacteria bacterium]|nr:dihydrofolate reductase [Gammaproteobacteria bacterium]